MGTSARVVVLSVLGVAACGVLAMTVAPVGDPSGVSKPEGRSSRKVLARTDAPGGWVATVTTLTAASAPPTTLTATTVPKDAKAPPTTMPPVAAPTTVPPEPRKPLPPATTQPRQLQSTSTTAAPAPEPATEEAPRAACATTGAVPGAAAAPAGVAFDPAAEARFLQLTNEERAKVGAEPLSVNPVLQSYARNHALTMIAADRGLFHSNINNIFAYTSCLYIGENVGLGPTVNGIQQALVASPGHYENLANGRFQLVGIAVAVDGTGRIWTAHVFAS